MAESISKVAGSAAVVAEQILDMDSDVSSDDEQSDWEPSQNSRGSEVDDEIAAQEEEIAGLLSERDSNMEENGAETQESPKKRVRKRQRNPSKWKVNVRKRLCQSGKKYTNVRGKDVPEKQVKNHKDCADKCKYRCVMAITEEQRESIFLEFYKLDQSTKYSFIASTSKCTQTARPKGGPSRRKKSFSYNFVVDGKEIRVCKQYYLGTLSISQKMVYTVHEKANPITGTPKPDGRGKYPKKVINNERKQAVMDHIKSFSVVESHYCRASTKKQYLEPQLNIQKMYDMYQETCEQQHLQPVKCSYYRHIFDTEFNYSFHKPKSDRCDRCEEYKISSKEGLLNDELTAEYQAHIEEKNAMRTERQEDRHDKNCLVICFDLENVITCPKADTSCFFYKRKLNVYNLTAHVSKNKQGYCAIWPENVSGRAGNDIASAVIKVLKSVVHDHPDVKHMITWSDSCVPQNRNSIISFAVAKFMEQNPHIETITMKYSTPGHSCIQEVDNIHSNIERAMSVAEFYSPISFIRVLLHANRKSPYKVLQMRAEDFKDYQACAKTLHYSSVPYTKVSQIKFTREFHKVFYKESPTKKDFNIGSIAQGRKRRSSDQDSVDITSIVVKSAKKQNRLSVEKKKDLKDMLKYMPLLDRQFYDSIF